MTLHPTERVCPSWCAYTHQGDNDHYSSDLAENGSFKAAATQSSELVDGRMVTSDIEIFLAWEGNDILLHLSERSCQEVADMMAKMTETDCKAAAYVLLAAARWISEQQS